MLIEWNKITNFYIACGYTDMRKQIDGLAAIVRLKFGMELDEQSLFLFCGRKADRIKALYWDGTGYILLYKRMVDHGFQWPRNQNEVRQITKQQLTWLLDGLCIDQKKAFKKGPQPTLF